MAGIYIHIPFCRQKCYYCDFYKTVNTSLTTKFLPALKSETIARKAYLEDETIETIYFGGGTPSVLTEQELAGILDTLYQQFTISENVEITFEANPDDLSVEYLQGLKRIGVNRLSIGIQSFQDKFLKKMNRRHTTLQALEAIGNAANLGFSNISIDLIYGLPDLTSATWKKDLEKAFKIPVQHLSAYHLTYHEGTAFYTWLEKGTLKELKEAESVSQFKILVEQAEINGFEQYEISNFAKDRLYSKHNSSYWLGTKYLGLGPSAHSYNGVSRRWNVLSTEGYINSIQKGTSFYEEEQLTDNDKYNEYVLTRIRTIWGVSENEILSFFGAQKASYFRQNIAKYVQLSMVLQQEDIFTLTKKGMFVSDEITGSLIII